MINKEILYAFLNHFFSLDNIDRERFLKRLQLRIDECCIMVNYGRGVKAGVFAGMIYGPISSMISMLIMYDVLFESSVS